ncbi:unnamed protein product, partial [Mesorhabditis spiculigera]
MPEEPQNITFLSTKKTVATFYQGSSSNTAISFRPNTLNCTVELFSYGWPSDAGKASYLLFRVSPANYRNLTPSRYWGRAVTLVLPASCAAGFQIEKIEAPETTNYTLGAREDFGYISSRDYPLVGDAGPSKISINVLLNETVLNDSEVQLNLLELVAYEPGSNSDQLTIIFGEAGSKNFSTPQKNLQLKGTGQMQIIFEPAKMDSHFLIRYETKAVLERKTFVNLNAVDSSYTLNGNMVKDIDIFSIYVDGPPTTYVFPYFAAQSRTDFEIIDAENNVFSSKDLSAASNFTGNIQLDFTGNKNWDFALIFRLDYGKIELASDVDFALLTLDASQSVTVEIGTKNRTSVYSFVTPFNRTFPCALIQNISMSCPQISLYTGGYYRNLTTSPGKYLLYEFGEDYTDNFYASQIRSFSFSLEIPENCDVSFELTENCEGNPDLSYNTVPLGGHGFFMSDAYRQNDNFWANRPLEIEIRANDTENTTEIALNFAAFDAGFENGASVFIDFSGSNSTLNLFAQEAVSVDLTVNLNAVDASYVMNGYLFKNTSIDRLLVTVDDPNLSVYVLSKFDSQNETNFWIADAKTAVLQSNELPAYQVFQGAITVDLSANQNFNFAMIFRRIGADEADILKKTTFTVISWLPGAKGSPIMSAGDDQYSVMTILAPFEREYPTLQVEPLQMNRPNCKVVMYAGGQPSAAGAEKYRLYDFTNATSDFQLSCTIRVFAVTFVVPSLCGLIVALEENIDTIAPKVVDGSHGFAMSNAYRQMDNLWRNDRPLDTIYSLDAPKPNSINGTFDVTVASFEPGVNSTLTFNFEQNTKVFAEKAQNANFSDASTAMSVRYEPTTSDSGFLIRYRFSTGDTAATDATSSTAAVITATTTKDGARAAFSLSILMVLIGFP